jgi:hypothetical protein
MGLRWEMGVIKYLTLTDEQESLLEDVKRVLMANGRIELIYGLNRLTLELDAEISSWLAFASDLEENNNG